jgi:glutamine synthetase
MDHLPVLPATLHEAIGRFEGSPLATEAFGAEVVRHYALLARHEQAFFDRSVSDLERARYFERI